MFYSLSLPLFVLVDDFQLNCPTPSIQHTTPCFISPLFLSKWLARGPEICVKASSLRMNTRIGWCPGMRFKLASETEDSSRSIWFMGTIWSVQVVNPFLWPNSPWLLLQVLNPYFSFLRFIFLLLSSCILESVDCLCYSDFLFGNMINIFSIVLFPIKKFIGPKEW